MRICSRSAVVSERVVLWRKPSTKRASSALRAASAGDAESPRVSFTGFRALMICSAEGCSAASTTPVAAGKAKPVANTMQARLILSVLAGDMFLSQLLVASAGLSLEPQDQFPDRPDR